jgi:hypothetical protein
VEERQCHHHHHQRPSQYGLRPHYPTVWAKQIPCKPFFFLLNANIAIITNEEDNVLKELNATFAELVVLNTDLADVRALELQSWSLLLETTTVLETLNVIKRYAVCVLQLFFFVYCHLKNADSLLSCPWYISVIKASIADATTKKQVIDEACIGLDPALAGQAATYQVHIEEAKEAAY